LAHHETGLPPNTNPANSSFATDKTPMPLRSLVILIAVALVIYAARRLWQSSRPAGRRDQKSARMVQCAHCGVYIPEHEALTRGDRYYCSAEHLTDDKG
jgi:uncharacterized protein